MRHPVRTRHPRPVRCFQLAPPIRIEVLDQRILLTADPGDILANAVDTGIGPGALVYSSDEAIGDGTNGSADIDLFRFEALAGQRLTAQAIVDPSDLDSDTILRLFDDAGIELAFNDDAGGTLGSLIETTLDFDGTYFVGVSGFGNDFYDPLTGDDAVPGSPAVYQSLIELTVPFDAGDTLATAFDIGVGPGSGDFFVEEFLGNEASGNRDVDLYRFTANAGALLQAAAFDGLLDETDTFLILFDANGNLIDFNDDAFVGTRSAFLATQLPETGTYFIGVSGFGNSAYDPVSGASTAAGSSGPYQFFLSLVSVETTPLALASDGTGSASGRIDEAGETDRFAIEIPQDGILTIRLDAAGEQTLDPIVTVFDADGFTLARNDDDFLSSGLNSRVELLVFSGQTLFVESSGFGATTGEYELSLSAEFFGDDDAGDTPSAALPLTTGADGSVSQAGEFGRMMDVDVFSYTAPVDASLDVRLIATIDGVDPVLSVFDTQGNLVAFNDDDASSLSFNSRLTVSVNAGDTLFFQAEEFSGGIGSYLLSIEPASPVVDDFGNTLGSASPLELTSGTASVAGRIEVFADRDVFAITPDADGLLAISVDAVDESSSGTGFVPLLDPTVTVFDASGARIAFDDDSGPGLNSLVSVAAQSGQTVYVEVAAFGNRGTGSYIVSAVLDRGQSVIDDFGNDISSATQLALPTGGSQQSLSQPGRIELARDVDVFQLTLPQDLRPGDSLRIRQVASGTNSLGSRLDSLLVLLDENGNVITSNDDDGLTLNSQIVIGTQGLSQLFIVAGAYESSTGGYDLVFDLISDDFGNRADSAEPLAGPIPGDDIQIAGVIEQPGDTDVFQFTAVSNGRVRVNQQNSVGSDLDSLLTVFLDSTDNNGQRTEDVIARNDDSNGTLDSQVSFDVKAGTTYFVRAGAFGQSAGAYDLSITSVTADQIGDTIQDAASLVLSDGSGRVDGLIDFTGDRDVFAFEADREGTAEVTVESRAGLITDVAVFQISDDGNPERIASDLNADANASPLSFDVQVGRRYFVQIDGAAGSSGGYTLNVDLTDAASSGLKSVPQNVFDNLLAVLRDQFAAGVNSGRDLDELLDEVIAEFRAAVGNNLGDDQFFFYVADPVDSVVTDSSGRDVGFTADAGRIVENPGARLSQNGPIELLILPSTDRQFQVQLQGVGAEYRVSGQLVTQAGNLNARVLDSNGSPTATTGSMLDKSDGNIQLVFDFTAPNINTIPAQAVIAGQPETPAMVTTVLSDANPSGFGIGDEVTLVSFNAAEVNARDRLTENDADSSDLFRVTRQWLAWLRSIQADSSVASSPLASGAGVAAQATRLLDAAVSLPLSSAMQAGMDTLWERFGTELIDSLWQFESDGGKPVPESQPQQNGGDEPQTGSSSSLERSKVVPATERTPKSGGREVPQAGQSGQRTTSAEPEPESGSAEATTQRAVVVN